MTGAFFILLRHNVVQCALPTKERTKILQEKYHIARPMTYGLNNEYHVTENPPIKMIKIDGLLSEGITHLTVIYADHVPNKHLTALVSCKGRGWIEDQRAKVQILILNQISLTQITFSGT